MADNVDAAPFIHLHLHSEYSLLDGANRIDELVTRVKELGMDAVAVTDHGNLHAAAQFYAAATRAGVKPILGIEGYVAPDTNGRPGDRRDKTYTGIQDGGFHLVLLAENQTGWANLLKLSSDAYLNGFYYKPRMDKSTLAQWHDGLIAINGHLGSSLAHYLTQYERTKDEAHWKAAIAEAKWHAETFGANEQGEPRFYIELQRHIQEQEAINPHLVHLAGELDLPLVCDNDAHFLKADDHDAHDSLICISTGKIKDDTARMTYPADLYVKSPEEMADLFAGYLDGAGDEALANTRRIADRCNVELDFNANHAPVVKVVYRGGNAVCPDAAAARKQVKAFKCEHPLGSTEWYKAFCAQFELHPYDSHKDHDSNEQLKTACDGALRLLAEAGAVWRYGPDGITDEIRARMERELGVLADKLISAYFLIVWDFVNFARANGIPANARGSGVGTMVGYCLGLSNACPVHYGLLFERFTDPDRSEYPDIDIDLCQDGRAAVIDYVRRKYGHVAQIITFGTMKARAAIRDVGRVLNIPLAEVDRIAKLIPEQLGITLDEALDAEADLRAERDGNPQYAKLIETARRLEGMARHASVHAAGVVLATQPLDNIVPLYRASGSDETITQWDGPTCEKVGLLKMDFLGLRTLSIIQRAKDLVAGTLDDATIRATVGVPDKQADALDLERLTYNDQHVFDLFRRGQTKGVFQFESGGMRDLLMAMAPDRLEDLIAANALYRPGPMALIPDYNDRKHDRAPVPEQHPIVAKFTNDTYGIMIYQEQVMQIVHELGDTPLRAAYTLIKAISKKKKDVIDANRPRFIEGAKAKGLSEREAAELFDLILKFAGYGFNKSHSAGYAIVAYQTAYLKTYFPVHYMAALLTYESVSTDKVVEYIDECRRVQFPDGHVGIDVRPPEINQSYTDFTVVYDKDEPHDANHGHIRFGLGAVKGVGAKAVDAIIAARDAGGPFRSLFDFCERVPSGSVNKSCIEALIKCGAFDDLHDMENRAAMMAAVETAVSRGAQEANLRSADDFLFGEAADAPEPAAAQTEDPPLPMVAPWNRREQLDQEKSVLGFYVSSHPLDDHRDELERFASASIGDVRNLRADAEIVLGGIISRVRQTFVKNGRSAGQKMAMITLEDRASQVDGVIFSDAYARYAHLIQPDALVFVRCKVDRRREEPSIRVEEVIPIHEAASHLAESVRIVLRELDSEGRPRHFNGELKSLRNMFRQIPGKARVYLEVHEQQRVVTLETGVRIAPADDLPERVGVLLHDPACCQLVGPPRIDLTNGNAAHNGAGPVDRLVREHDEVCDSIDRY